MIAAASDAQETLPLYSFHDDRDTEKETRPHRIDRSREDIFS
jgi:hypothetical protein